MPHKFNPPPATPAALLSRPLRLWKMTMFYPNEQTTRLTQVIRDDRRLIRRLELDEKSGVVTWGIDRVMGVFGNPYEQVKLFKARIMCADKLVKIGRAGRRDFFVFEACDAQEAAAVCDCLVAVAKKLQEEARG